MNEEISLAFTFCAVYRSPRRSLPYSTQLRNLVCQQPAAITAMVAVWR